MKNATINGQLFLNGATSAKLTGSRGEVTPTKMAEVEVGGATSATVLAATALPDGEVILEARGTGAAASLSGTLNNTDAAGNIAVALNGTQLAVAGPGQAVPYSVSMVAGDKLQFS